MIQTSSFHQIEETNRIVQEIIENLSPKSIEQLLAASSGDLETFVDTIFNETYSTLFGNLQGIDAASSLGNFNSSSLHYVDKISESVEETLRTESILYFMLSVFQDSHEINWHHIEWADMVTYYRYLCILAARGHGKSWFFSMVVGCWKLYRYNKNSKRRELSLLGREGYFFSNTATSAERLVKLVADQIKENPILYERLHPTSGKGLGVEKLMLKNGSELNCLGMGSSARGPHPGWIIIDDLPDDSSLYSKEQREKVIEYVKSGPLKMLEPGGLAIIVGTPFHEDDLYGWIKKYGKGWHFREYPAIFPDGKILWDRRFSFDFLMQSLDNDGKIAFSREMLCKPVVNDSTIFPFDILQKSIYRMESYQMVDNIESFPVRFERIGVGCDFAISSNIGSDSSVFIVGGIDEYGCVWVLNMYRMNGKSYAQQMNVISTINRDFRPDIFCMESNGFQKIFAEEARTLGIPAVEHRTGENKYDPKKGLPSLALMFEQGKIKIPTGNLYSTTNKDMMFSELGSIAYTSKGLQATSGHDDIGMALWFLTSGLKRHSEGFEFGFL